MRITGMHVRMVLHAVPKGGRGYSSFYRWAIQVYEISCKLRGISKFCDYWNGMTF